MKNNYVVKFEEVEKLPNLKAYFEDISQANIIDKTYEMLRAFKGKFIKFHYIIDNKYLPSKDVFIEIFECYETIRSAKEILDMKHYSGISMIEYSISKGKFETDNFEEFLCEYIFKNKSKKPKELSETHKEIISMKILERSDHFSELKALYLSNKIRNITGLSKLRKLELLCLNDNKIRKIEGLENLCNLKRLYFDKNKIRKIKGVGRLRYLKVLNLSNNEIRKIKRLNKLINLEKLDLSNNKIRKIKRLEELINLKMLNLSNNKIKKIVNLDKLINLEILYLDKNKIRNMEGLNDLKNLQYLGLSFNEIRNIEGLEGLNKLQTLRLDKNKITNIEKIEAVKNFDELTNIYLDYNPITRQEILEQLFVLNMADFYSKII